MKIRAGRDANVEVGGDVVEGNKTTTTREKRRKRKPQPREEKAKEEDGEGERRASWHERVPWSLAFGALSGAIEFLRARFA